MVEPQRSSILICSFHYEARQVERSAQVQAALRQVCRAEGRLSRPQMGPHAPRLARQQAQARGPGDADQETEDRMTSRPQRRKLTNKQRVLREIKRRYGSCMTPRVCVTGHDKLLYLVIGFSTTVGVGKTVKAAWADAARRLK